MSAATGCSVVARTLNSSEPTAGGGSATALTMRVEPLHVYVPTGMRFAASTHVVSLGYATRGCTNRRAAIERPGLRGDRLRLRRAAQQREEDGGALHDQANASDTAVGAVNTGSSGSCAMEIVLETLASTPPSLSRRDTVIT